MSTPAGPLRVLVTGATGFVGQAVVATARRRGHSVRAVVRPASGGLPRWLRSPDGPEADDPEVEEVRLDLRSTIGLHDAVHGVDTVIHLAAAKEGDFATQFAGTVVATENLLGAMDGAGARQLVGVSTLSVYDYRAMGTGQLVTEDSPIDRHPARRDEYAQTKLLQERLYHQFGSATDGRRVVILRPGMIYGPGNLWHALLGAEVGPSFVRVGSRATLPLTYVENAAEAMVLAAERLAENPGAVDGEIINIVDDDLPSQARYVAMVEKVIDPPSSVTVPWPVVRAGTSLIGRANDLAVGGRAKFPGILVSERVHARFKPLTYTNVKAKRLLGWTPRYSLSEAISRSRPQLADA